MFGKGKNPKQGGASDGQSKGKPDRVRAIVFEEVDLPRERAGRPVVDAAKEITRKAAEGK